MSVSKDIRAPPLIALRNLYSPCTFSFFLYMGEQKQKRSPLKALTGNGKKNLKTPLSCKKRIRTRRKGLFLPFFLTLFFGLPTWPQDGEPSPSSPSFFVQAVPFLVMFLIFYFLIIRPQVKKQQTQQEFLKKLKKGDRVLTTGGILGTIDGLTNQYVTLTVDENVSLRVSRTHISQKIKGG